MLLLLTSRLIHVSGSICLGYNCISDIYVGTHGEANLIKTLHAAIDHGKNMLKPIVFFENGKHTMTLLIINIPKKLHQKECEVSKMNNMPIDEIIAASLANKLHRIIPDPYLEERAKRATGEGFSVVLSQVPDVPPEECDKL